MSLDWTSGALAEGLACYSRAEFFHAHEHWESVWIGLQEPEKRFLQALIQIAVAFHHLQAGNSAGAISLLRRVLRRIEILPPTFGGISVAPLCAEVRAWLHVLEGGQAHTSLAPPQICPLETSTESPRPKL
jgi:predicted metal-dependent hydrolase